ncbi:MAG: hypothetical protein ACRCR9_03025 [Chitinophagaceae bacterium]
MIHKEEIFKQVLQQFVPNFTIVSKDTTRAWGAFALIDESEIDAFIDSFFKEDKSDLKTGEFKKLSPKILLVSPLQRLSWQYHYRRSEIWRVLQGPVGLVVSQNDEETEVQILQSNHIVRLDVGTRHRLVGLEDYAVLAEIWKHTDPQNPSNEEDIVRLQDDFGR